LFIDGIGRRHVIAGLSTLPLIGWSKRLFAKSPLNNTDQPYFRFVPSAYENELCFTSSQQQCEICEKPCVWRYTGNVYAVNDPEILCARCIADGRLGKHFGSESFGLHDSDVGASRAFWEEINHRTPGIPTWNPIQWPVIEGIPLAFVAVGETKQFPTGADVDDAVAKAWQKIEHENLGPINYVLLFKQIDGPQYRAIIDFD
jgi:uncharacterized protein